MVARRAQASSLIYCFGPPTTRIRMAQDSIAVLLVEDASRIRPLRHSDHRRGGARVSRRARAGARGRARRTSPCTVRRRAPRPRSAGQRRPGHTARRRARGSRAADRRADRAVGPAALARGSSSGRAGLRGQGWDRAESSRSIASLCDRSDAGDYRRRASAAVVERRQRPPRGARLRHDARARRTARGLVVRRDVRDVQAEPRRNRSRRCTSRTSEASGSRTCKRSRTRFGTSRRRFRPITCQQSSKDAPSSSMEEIISSPDRCSIPTRRLQRIAGRVSAPSCSCPSPPAPHLRAS